MKHIAEVLYNQMMKTGSSTWFVHPVEPTVAFVQSKIVKYRSMYATKDDHLKAIEQLLIDNPGDFVTLYFEIDLLVMVVSHILETQNL
jgi:hypothetical protein